MQQPVKEYFAKKATAYDDVDDQPYWKFSDELLWYLLQYTVLPLQQETHFQLLDAGAGTARWTFKTLSHYPNARAHLIDISEEMLSQAKSKLEKSHFLTNTTVQIGDIRNMHKVSNESIDVIYCLHNVMGFFDDSITALRNFYEKLRLGGKCAVMFPSFYHALYFSNATGRQEQTARIMDQRQVQYNDLMPHLKVFELSEIRTLQQQAGFRSVRYYGFPLTVYPGMEETLVHGSTANLVQLFTEPYRSQLLSIEKNLCVQEELSARGNNILAVFIK